MIKNKSCLNLKNKKPDIRHLNEMRDLLYDKKWAKSAPNLELYYMYRRLRKKKGLRYDITVIPAKMLGSEFVKTKGHNHFNKCGEIYIILKGRTIFLLQKYEKGKLKDVYAVKAKKGEIISIPPYYYHIIINPSEKELITANWVAEKDRRDYSLIEKKQGLCYYYTKKGWIKNKNYKNIPKLRFKKPLKTLPNSKKKK